MHTLNIDVETFSDRDLKQTGMYKYFESPNFEILMFVYSFDDGPEQMIDLKCGQKLPADILFALTDPNCQKFAYNAPFERGAIAAHFKLYLDPIQWFCTMIKGVMCGLPMGLDKAAEALQLTVKKSFEGSNLIRFFCIPCKPTLANGMRTRNLPAHDMEKWDKFKSYCIQDVVVEKAIKKRLEFFTVPDTERRLWSLDQKINDHGLLLDPSFAANAVEQNFIFTEKLKQEIISITGIKNAKSVKQIKDWLSLEINELVPTLSKGALPPLLEKIDSATAKRVIELRQLTSKSSIDKYKAMLNMVMDDDYIRGIFQFYGAGRTGRWAGRGVQPHNLIKNEDKFKRDLDIARRIVAANDTETLEMCYSNITYVLSQLIRTAFVAPPGKKLLMSDFSAIEARVIAWLAGEQWRLDVFKTHGKIYEASASAMFGIPIEQITKTSPYRDKGKVSELALGFQGSVGALVRMGALLMGLTEEELPEIVARWRAASPRIVQMWRDINDITIQVVRDKSACRYKNLYFHMEKGVLFITLPSGRKLSYLRAGLKENKYGNLSVTYMGVDQKTKQWVQGETYGGKLVENIVQAIARDLLAEAMIRLDDAGYCIAGHVHDEVILEVDINSNLIVDVNGIMSYVPAWAEGLPLAAASFESPYYKKD